MTDKKKTTGLDRGTKMGVIAVLGIVALIIGFIVFNVTKSYPIGDNKAVVYLGKEHHGDGIVAPSYDLYYYGTDMGVEELAGYFNGTNGDPIGIGYGYLSYDLALSVNNNKIPITFYKEKDSTYLSPPDWARATSKNHFFYIIDDGYDGLKESLEKNGK